MSTHYKVDLGTDEVIEMAGPIEEMHAGSDVDDDEQEDPAVDALVSDYAPDLGHEDPAVDLSEDEKPQEQDRPDEDSGNYFGVEDIERIAAEDVDALSDEQRADNELHEELKRQAHADRFGEDDLAGVSDEDLWRAYKEAWGMEED